MFGFVVGTLCLFGLAGMFRARRRYACGDHAYHHHPGWRGRRGRRRGRGRSRDRMARVAGEVFKRKLDIDDDQEGIVDHAVADLKDALKELGETLQDSRTDVADAFRGDEVDDVALASVFSRHDEALERARRQVVSALKQVHAVLDDDQRELAADWLGTRTGWV